MKNTIQKNEGVSLPNFLAFSFDDFDFEIEKNTSTNTELALKIKSKYQGENTIIVFDNKIIFNSANDVFVSVLNSKQIDDKKGQNTNVFETINKKKLTSAIEIFVEEKKEADINLIVASSGNLIHFTNIVLNESAKAKVFELPLTLNGFKANTSVNINLNKNSCLDYVLLEEGKTKNANDVFCQNAKVFENGHLQLSYLNLNNSNAVNHTTIELVGEHARGEIKTITFASKNQKLASFMEILHGEKQTISDIKNIGFVNENAKLSIDGINQIDKGNSKSEAEQETRIINLSAKAMSIANPQLIINEYDVKAGHAAAVGQIDEEGMFYIQSRGLTKREAIKLLAQSYINPVMAKLNGKKYFEKYALKLIDKKIY